MVQKYISEFNKHAKSIKFLSYTDEIALANKLKLIQSQDVIENVCSSEVQEFFSNVYNLLCQSANMKSDLLGNCVEILLECVNSQSLKLRTTVLSDSRLLSALIDNILDQTEENKLLKMLTLVRELISYSSALEEHHLKLIVEVLKEHIANHENEDINTICLEILANLCLENNSARHLITRSIKSTKLQERIGKISNSLIAFKFFLLVEDEIQPSDAKYFFIMSLQELRKSIADFRLDSIRYSLDILKHIHRLGLRLETRLSEDEKFIKTIADLNEDLISSFLNSSVSDKKWNFFDGIFDFYNKLLLIDCELVEPIQKLAETTFISGVISKSSKALQLLTTFVKNNGTLGTLGIVIETLLDVFITGDREMISYEQKYSFLCLLDALQEKDKLSEGHLVRIGEYFDDLIDMFKGSNITSIDDQEAFLFIYFLFALSSITKARATFYGKLNNVLKLDFLPLLVAKAHRSANEEIMMIIWELTTINNFPKKKVASLLIGTNERTKATSVQSPSIAMESQNQLKSSRHITTNLADDLIETIARVNERLANNEDVNNSDITFLYRQKYLYLNDHLTSVTSSHCRSNLRVNELLEQIASFRKVSEKQESSIWCLQLDNERLLSEVKTLADDNNMLKDSVSKFKLRIDKEEGKRRKIEDSVNEEIKQRAILEKKLTETKEKLRLAMDENESRIKELKESLDNEKKMKSKELADAAADQKRMSQKLVSAEKESFKLQEIIKHNEKEILSMREKIQNYESELKESEQMRSTIMNLMQTKSFRK